MKRLGVPPGMLERFSGIQSRRQFDEAMPPSEAATEAGQRAIEAAAIDRDQLGVVVNTSVCRDFVEPSTAAIVHRNLGLAPTCLNFDISNACLAFINGMEMVSNMIEQKQIDFGIVVNAENTKHATQQTIERLSRPDTTWEAFRDAFATLTLGSGAVAMVLARAQGIAGEHRFLGGVNLSATEHCRLCYATVDSMVTNAKKLLNHGMELAFRTWTKARDVHGLDAGEYRPLHHPPGRQGPHRTLRPDPRHRPREDLPPLPRTTATSDPRASPSCCRN